MSTRIKYICFYDSPNNDHIRGYAQSSADKMLYIWSVLNRCGYNVDVVSVSSSTERKFCIDKGRTEYFNDSRNSLRLFTCLGGPKWIRYIGRIMVWFAFSVWFLLNVKNNELIFVYHSLGYCRLFNSLKHVRRFRMIGEIEEIYQDVHKQRKRVAISEYKFIKNCEGYLFSTELLNNKLNVENKPYVVIYGIYSSMIQERDSPGTDEIIHVVYAGTFDPVKGGAKLAIASARFLPQNYHLHICGFGGTEDVESVKRLIAEENKCSQALISYEGLLKGDDLVKFLKNCQVGLSTQNPNVSFNATSFPSKILMYLVNGLDVVTIRIPVIELSKISKCVTFYDSPDPGSLANAIINCKIGRNKKSNIISSLDTDFCESIDRLIKRIQS